MKGKLLLLATIFMLQAKAQTSNSELWNKVTESAIPKVGKRQIIPQKYMTLSANSDALKRKLFSAPEEKNTPVALSSCIISLPLPNGTYERFRVVCSPVMADEAALAFPNIKTFNVHGIDNPHSSGKLDWNEFGFHGMVFSPEGDFFIDPYCLNDTQHYLSYYTHDFIKPESDKLPEIGVIVDENSERRPAPAKSIGQNSINAAPPAVCVGTQLRTYRLAIACTGEYAIAATGQGTPSLAQTVSKIITTVNRVNGVYEKEVSVRLVLVPSYTNVVFTNTLTDPFTANNNGNLLINESQTVISSTIGSANYDIGHTFSSGGGGLANLNCVCQSGSKARGVTGSPNPVGDPYDIDYVCHEMGHQFGAEHTFNAITDLCNGNRVAATSVEPGSGITIMSYAGICGANNLASNSIPYFHAISYDQIVNFITSPLANCAVTSTTGNSPPSVNNISGQTVPVSTPFYLTGTATDPNGDALTYSWEETDSGLSSGNWNSGQRPFFQSYPPVTTPTRFFPAASVALSGNFTGTKGEYMPTTPQTLNFRLTARDNKMGGGGVCYSNISVTVDAAGPLMVTNPNTVNINWASGSTQNITWDVNNTHLSPINAASVNILISYNSGSTYTTLVAATPNDGIQTITAPSVAATIPTCRIKIEAVGNVFYDIGDNDFRILAPGDGVGINEVSQNNELGLNVWPNPTNDEVNVVLGNLNNSVNTFITIVNLLGETVLTVDAGNHSFLKDKINVSNLPSGVYFIKATNANKQSVHRLLKE